MDVNENLLNVFQYWGQGLNAMPFFLQKIYKHNLDFCKKNNINLILIDDNNVNNYITPHVRFKNLAYNFKSDIIRYYILHKYGGFWFDTDVIIIKDLNNLRKYIDKQECMLDVEFDKKIGCASLFIKKQSQVSIFCVNYINNILNKNKTLEWNDIGPNTVNILYKKYSSLILLNNYETVKNGCNFICWKNDPGINKKDWYLKTEKDAENKAKLLQNNKDCYYLITWTIYRINNMGSNLINMCFLDKRSVFFYFINYEHDYAVMSASTVNIGDDIQTLAAINFLKKKGITEYTFIDREKLSDYNGKPVTMIMNGWYMNNIYKFPPSNKIKPIFISVHINTPELIERNISYFKKHEPIGCRDEATVKLFKKHGIKAYFTGCLTLLFDDVNEKTEKKYLVDVNTKCEYIPNIEFDTSKYNDYESIEHDININMKLKDRLTMAENLLNKYRTAEKVITTRLNCILPCRAFNTNSIFIHKNYETNPKFQGLKNVINGDVKYNNNNIHGSRDEIENIRKNLLLIDV
jgi:hypothetical protein